MPTRLAPLVAGSATAALTLALLLPGPTRTARAQDESPGESAGLAAAAAEILKANCVQCHGPEVQRAKLRLDDAKSYLDPKRKKRAVAPGKPDESEVVKRVESEDDVMPPGDSCLKPLGDGDRKSLRAWITSLKEPAAEAEPGADTAGETNVKADLGTQAKAILQRHCASCHSEKGEQSPDLTKPWKGWNAGSENAIVAGVPRDSVFLQRVLADEMPPKGKNPVKPGDRQVLEQWVASLPKAAAVARKSKDEAAAQPVAKAADASPAGKAVAFLQQNCAECHNGPGAKSNVKLDDFGDSALTALREKNVLPKTGGAYTQTNLWQALRDPATEGERRSMPPKRKKAYTDAELKPLAEWLEAGAPAPGTGMPPFDPKRVGSDYVLRAIAEHTRRLVEQDDQAVRYARYFSLNHLLRSLDQQQKLDHYLDAFVLTLNHLTWSQQLVMPTPIEPTGTVFYVDIRKLKWHMEAGQPYFQVNDYRDGQLQSKLDLWDLILLEYPYGRQFDPADGAQRSLKDYMAATEMVRPIPYVRADWFVQRCGLAPMYNDLLELAPTLPGVEHSLGVARYSNIQNGDAVRAGTSDSGVSKNIRMIERHTASAGTAYYWLSYDFAKSVGTQRKNPKTRPTDFIEDGGEVIWRMPNGTQGYYVALANGNRLDAAPLEIVVDKHVRDQTVRNGVSCIRCHDEGTKGIADEWHDIVRRPGNGIPDRQMAQRLYAGQAAIDEHLSGDRAEYKKTLERLAALRRRADPAPPSADPSAAGDAKWARPDYRRETFASPYKALEMTADDLDDTNLTPRRVQAELETTDASVVADAAAALRRLGVTGGTKRDTWEDVYHRVLAEVGSAPGIPPADATIDASATSADAIGPRPLATDVANCANIDEIVTLKTDRANYRPGEDIRFTVRNDSPVTVYIELIGSSPRGEVNRITTQVLELPPGESYTTPLALGVKAAQGATERSRVILYWSDRRFDPGVLAVYRRGREENVALPDGSTERRLTRNIPDRFIHLKQADLSRLWRKRVDFDS